MKLDGFKLHSIYLEADGESFDLHNCYDFTALDYDVARGTLRLRWAPSAYAPPGEHRSPTITFHKVTHFSATPRDVAMPSKEDQCLNGIYFPMPGTDRLAYLDAGYEIPPGSPYVFCFMSGFSFRVIGKSAQLHFQ